MASGSREEGAGTGTPAAVAFDCGLSGRLCSTSLFFCKWWGVVVEEPVVVALHLDTCLYMRPNY